MGNSKNLTTREVARLLNCSESLARRKDMKEVLGAFYIGKKSLRYPQQKVELYLLNQQHSASDSTATPTDLNNTSSDTKRRKIDYGVFR